VLFTVAAFAVYLLPLWVPPKVREGLSDLSYLFHRYDGYDATAKVSPVEYWTETSYEAWNQSLDRRG
jgi:hypothetical protein